MPKFLVDECVLGLYTPQHQKAFAAKGWGYGSVGFLPGLGYSTPDPAIYQYAVQNGFTHIITSNRGDFIALERQNQRGIVVVHVKRIYPAAQMIQAIEHSLVHQPNASIILVGQILNAIGQAAGGTP